MLSSCRYVAVLVQVLVLLSVGPVPCEAESQAASLDEAHERARGESLILPPLARIPEPVVGRRTIFVNGKGGVFTPGDDDSSQNRSRIPAQSSVVPAFSYGDEEWDEVMGCMQTLFAPFDVTITDVDPGTSIHAEIVIGGLPEDVQMDNLAGVASFEGCDASGKDIVVENGIVFVFSEVHADYLDRAQAICSTAAQEVGHLYGLDHLLSCGDPMTYLYCAGELAFHDKLVDCGEDVARECTCSGTQQNSYRHLLSLFGESTEGEGDPDFPDSPDSPDEDFDEGEVGGVVTSGCSASGQGANWLSALALGLMLVAQSRSRRKPRTAGR